MPDLSKEPRSKLRGILGWPGQLVVRVRERSIASAQEVTGIWSIACRPPVRVECLHANPDNKLSGPPGSDKPKQASGN
jgi:hypothetical protein